MKKVLDFAQSFDMLPRYELLIAAASGGMDSMCLLNFLYENGYRVCAAHFNHRLRGEEADMDEDLVRSWCAARRIPLCVGSGDAAEYARTHGLSLEEASRKLRYDFLNTAADQTGAVRVLTAHHADDCAETVLFHLARGTGLAGLAGIAPVNGRLARPFLCLTREEIAAYAKKRHVPYRTDATNADTTFTRNFIRAEILPRMERLNARAAEHIAETALRLRSEDELLNALAAERLSTLRTEEDGVRLSRAEVASAPEALRPRMLRLALDRLGAGKKDVAAVHYDALSALCREGRDGMRLSLPGGVTAGCEGGELTLRLRAPQREESVPLREGETVRWGEYEISCRVCEKSVEKSENTVILKDTVLAGPLSVGAWNASDRMTLSGARGARSVKRLLAERGFDPDEREGMPAVRAGEAVAAVYGVGADAAFAPQDERCVCVLEFRRARRTAE